MLCVRGVDEDCRLDQTKMKVKRGKSSDGWMFIEFNFSLAGVWSLGYNTRPNVGCPLDLRLDGVLPRRAVSPHLKRVAASEHLRQLLEPRVEALREFPRPQVSLLLSATQVGVRQTYLCNFRTKGERAPYRRLWLWQDDDREDPHQCSRERGLSGRSN